MQILEFRAENFARLKAVAIRPDGAVVPISGKNGQGKTSILRGIWALIEGRTVAPAVAIREGEDEATLTGDLGAYKITRTIKRDKEGNEEWTLKVVAADGTRVTKTPQAVINAFKGDMGFDPLGWCRLPSKDQAAALRALVKGFDFDEAAAQRLKAYTHRTTANRIAGEQQVLADKVALPPGPEPKAIDVAGKIDEMQAAATSNANRQAAADSRKREAEAVERLMDEAEQLRARAATLESDVAARLARLEALPPLPALIDTAKLRADIDSAQAVNAARDLHQKRRDHEASAKAAREESTALSARIEAIDKAQADAIAAAKLPVKGLSLGEDSVLLNGLPLAQAGTAEKIECAMAIAMAKNPDLKVVLVDEGSELDSDAMAFVAKLADKKGFQVWIAKVAEGAAATGFVIEDGGVRP